MLSSSYSYSCACALALVLKLSLNRAFCVCVVKQQQETFKLNSTVLKTYVLQKSPIDIWDFATTSFNGSINITLPGLERVSPLVTQVESLGYVIRVESFEQK